MVVAAPPLLVPGAHVIAKFKKRTRWYPGVVRQVNSDGTVWVDYDDGDVEVRVKPNLVKLRTEEEKAAEEKARRSRPDDAVRAADTRADGQSSPTAEENSQPPFSPHANGGGPCASNDDSPACLLGRSSRREAGSAWTPPREGSFVEVSGVADDQRSFYAVNTTDLDWLDQFDAVEEHKEWRRALVPLPDKGVALFRRVADVVQKRLISQEGSLMVMPGPGGEWQLEQLVAEQERSKARAVLHLRVYPPLCWLHTPIQLPRTPQPGGSLSSRVAHSTATNILWACLSNPRPALHQLESLACALFAQDPTLDASSGLSLVATARAVIKDIAAALLLPVPSPATLPSPPSLEEVHSKLAHPKPRKPTTKLEVPAQVGAPPSMPASDTAYRMMEDAERQAKRLKPVFGKGGQAEARGGSVARTGPMAPGRVAPSHLQRGLACDHTPSSELPPGTHVTICGLRNRVGEGCEGTVLGFQNGEYTVQVELLHPIQLRLKPSELKALRRTPRPLGVRESLTQEQVDQIQSLDWSNVSEFLERTRYRRKCLSEIASIAVMGEACEGLFDRVGELDAAGDSAEDLCLLDLNEDSSPVHAGRGGESCVTTDGSSTPSDVVESENREPARSGLALGQIFVGACQLYMPLLDECVAAVLTANDCPSFDLKHQTEVGVVRVRKQFPILYQVQLDQLMLCVSEHLEEVRRVVQSSSQHWAKFTLTEYVGTEGFHGRCSEWLCSLNNTEELYFRWADKEISWRDSNPARRCGTIGDAQSNHSVPLQDGGDRDICEAL
ncbi:hypothetical protein AB1Y20_011557 [Prymnesium parvum]|uniref:Tudor domain-containing protein n=1 Tax=Prymnesium parvum TaxID=97485 RepID=A0AB34IGV6_PRYPA